MHTDPRCRLFRKLWILIWVILCALPLTAAETESRYLQPFPVPEWLEGTHQRLLFDVYPTKEFKAKGVDLTCAGTNFSPFMYIWDGERIVHIETGEEVDYEHHRNIVKRADELDMKIFCPLVRFWHPILYNERPEWQELHGPDAKPYVKKGIREEWTRVNGCWVSPFGDFFIEQSVELGKRIGFHGYNLDGFGTFALCHCQFCKKAYREDMNADLPRNRDVKDLAYRKYMRWKLDKWTDFVWRWQKAIKAIDPNFAAVPWSTGPGRWLHWMYAGIAECSAASNRLIDCPILELFWDFPPDQGSNLLPCFVIRLYRGLAAERPVMMLPYIPVHGQMSPNAPPVERTFRYLATISNGALCSVGNWMVNDETPLEYYMDLIKAREPYTVKAKTVKWAAMLISENSRLFYGVEGTASELAGKWIGSGVDTPDASKIPMSQRRLPVHMESALGVFRAMTEAHLPIDIITSQDVEEEKRLDLYKVLVLPNAACLSDLEAEKIRAFVKGGGGLVAMHETSRYDEYGTPRDDFALADVFGASFRGIRNCSGVFPEYKNFVGAVLMPHEITSDPSIELNLRGLGDEGNQFIGRRVSYIGLMSKVAAKEGMRGLAYTVYRDEPREHQVRLLREGVVRENMDPMLFASSYGEGRVVYMPADFGQSNFVSPFPYQRSLLVNSIEWAAAGVEPPVEVDAPLCVQTNFFEQKKENRLVVHLLNEFNSAAGRSLPSGSPSAREEVVPLRDIRVTFRDRSIRSVRLEPEGVALPVTRSADGVSVTVPELRLHSMVVGER